MEEADGREAEPVENAVPLEYFKGIVRTGWIETAAFGHQRRNAQNIDPHWEHDDAFE